MPTQVQWRRGTTTQHNSFTGAAGEVTVDTTLDTLRVHDGSTAGGIRIAKYSELNSGDITAVVAGTGLSGGATSGSATVNLSHLGLESLSDPNDDQIIFWDDSAGATAFLDIGTGLSVSGTTLSSSITQYADSDARGAISVTDSGGDGSLAYNSSTGVITYTGPSASEVRAHITAGTGVSISSGEVSIGQAVSTSSNVTFADVTASSLDISGDVDVDGTLETDALTIGGSTLESVVEGYFSASDAGGDGSFSYSNGVFTYTGPSAAEVRAHLSAGTGVTYSGGAISIGQAVATTDDVTFADVAATGNVTITGNLDVNGTTTTLDTTNSTIADRLIELGTGTTGTPANDMGIVLERGSSDNAFIGWDESADKFLMGTGSFTGASTGNLTVTTGTLVANLEGNVTGNLTGTADLATSVTASANNTTDETVYITFVDGATGTQGIETDTGFTYNPASGALSVENADAGSSAGPVFTFYRNSASPADADYLGQIKFSGEDDGGATTVYSKITGKAGDVTNGTEDGVIEFAAQKAGTQTILARLLSTKLELINSTALDVDGAVTAASLDISGSADIDGTMEADAYTVDGVALNEYIADTVGAMVSSNTESGITVSYEDGDNTLDFAVGTLNQDTTGTADNVTVTANNSTNETVYPVFVDGATGSQGIESDTGLTYNPSSGVLTSTQFTGALSGNATTASALATARTLSFTGDVTGTGDFDGSGNLETTLTIAANSVALGTDTTGNYMAQVSGGDGITISHTQGEGSTATITGTAIYNAAGTKLN